jgi:hypothetical protein
MALIHCTPKNQTPVPMIKVKGFFTLNCNILSTYPPAFQIHKVIFISYF